MLTTTLWQAQWRERLVLVNMLVLLTLGVAAMIWVLWPRTEPSLRPVATLAELPVGAVKLIDLPAAFHDPAPPVVAPWRIFRPVSVPVYLSHDPAGTIVALLQRDPRSGCGVVWERPAREFIDPCHGSAYSGSGLYIRGPSPRSLDQFGVLVGSDGTIRVDVRDFRLGAGQTFIF